MELREYGHILLSRWWLLILLPLLAGGYSAYQNTQLPPQPVPTYMYDIQYSISFLPMIITDIDQDPRLGAVQVSEYVADDLTEIFEGTLFAQYVEQYLEEPLEDEDSKVSEAIRVAKAHRLVTLVLRAKTKSDLYKLADAVKIAIPNDIEPLLNELWGIGQVRLELVSDPGPVLDPASIFTIPGVNVTERMALALMAAITLAFGLEYLSDKIRLRRQIERAIGPVLAEIPPE